MAVRTGLSIMSLPALERNLDDLVEALCLILSTMVVNKSLFLLAKCLGRPRYFSDPPSFIISSVSFTMILVSSGFFDEKVIDDLSLLIF